MKPFSEACERNQGPILEILKVALAGAESVLEIGSGTGQHAVYLGRRLPHLTWQTGDLAEHHAGIRLWLEEADLPNVKQPISLDLDQVPWSFPPYDAIFSANVLHIVSVARVERFFAEVGSLLNTGGTLCLYGPFNYQGAFSSQSNARFDRWLRARDPLSGIRDFEWIETLARARELHLKEDYTMPANNRLLTWLKTGK